jgi:signal transduction histidine kinase
MRSFIAILFTSLCTLLSQAQRSRIDSLDHLISTSVTDTARIKLLLQKLAFLSSIDSAISLGKMVVDEAGKINYRKGEAEARQKLASKYNMKGEYPLAAENLVIAKNIYEALKDSLGLNYVWSTCGMMFGMQSKYDTSIRCFETAIGIAERNGYKSELPGDYGNIAIGYQMQSNFSQALRYQLKAFTLAKANNDIDDQAYVSLNIGQTYFAMGDSARAEQAYLESIGFAKSVSDKNVELYAYSNLAELHIHKKQPQKAYDYAIKAARLGRETGDQGIEAASLSKAARSLTEMNNFTGAEPLARQAISVADSSGQPLIVYQAYSAMGALLKRTGKYKDAIPYLKKSIDALQRSDIYDEAVGLTNYDLSLCYEETGDYRSALITYKTGSQILDSVRSRENIRKATELNMNYEHERKQEAQRIAQAQKDARTKERQIALMIGLGLMLILAGVAFTAFRNKKKANAILTLQKEEIQSTLFKLEATQKQLIQSEKMASLGELTAGIAHEIQNPLNFVNNFSEVNIELIEEVKTQKSKLKSGELDELLTDISTNLEKISHHGKRADAIVKGMLQHSRTSGAVKEPTDINKLADEYLRLAYHGLRAKDKSFNTRFETDFDSSVGIIKVVPQEIGRVILNLVNNAFYAASLSSRGGSGHSREKHDPAIWVSTKRNGDKVEIKVRDNGPGIPERILDKIFQPFFTTKPAGQGTGLGLSMSFDIITKGHGGQIRVNTRENEGTEFIIQLPAN